MSVDHRIMNRRLKFALLAYQAGIALLVLKPLLIIFGLRFNAHEWLADFPYRMVAGKIEPTITSSDVNDLATLSAMHSRE